MKQLELFTDNEAYIDEINQYRLAYIKGIKHKKDWRDESWNPITGCDRMSLGCDNCYALTMARRFRLNGQPKYQNDGNPKTSGLGFKLTLHPQLLKQPYTWKKPRIVFLGSMSDLFHRDVPTDFIKQIFEVVRNTPKHTYQIVTKRTHRLKQLATELDFPSNLWVGVSVETQKFAYRIKHLKETPAKIKFVGTTPLLGSLQLDLTEIDFVIAGPESGKNARPMKRQWMIDIANNCKDYNVPLITEEMFDA